MRHTKTATGSTVLDLVLLLVSGAGMWAAFPPTGIWALTVPSLALLVFMVDRVAPWRGAVYAAFWAMVFFVPHISWMYVATDGTWLAWFALAGAQAFFVGLWGASFSAMGTWSWARTAAGEAAGGALLWVTFEELRSRIPFGGFPWGKLAYPQVDSPMVAYAPIGGEVLVAFLVFFAAVLLRRVLAIREPAAPSPWGRLACLGVAAVIAFGPVFVRLPNSQQEGSVAIGVIQGNVEVPMAETFAIPRKVTGNHVRQTLEFANTDDPVDIVFWGENSTDIDPRTDSETYDMVAEASAAVGVPMVVGIMEYVEDVRYNWIAVWYPDGHPAGSGLADDSFYGKQHPVPWGEYIPFRELTLMLATAAAQISVDMVPVDNPAYLEVQLNDGRILPIATGICFEVAYEPLISEGVRMGGQLIYIPTNNAHFEDSAESVQQLQMAQFRAAEFSRSTIQVSTNGVSGVIRPDGSIMSQTETQEAASIRSSVPLRSNITLAAKMGEAPSVFVIVVGGVLSVASLGAHVYGKTLIRAHQRSSNRKRKN